MRPFLHRWWQRLSRTGKLALWLVVVYMVGQQVFGPYSTNAARTNVLEQFQ